MITTWPFVANFIVVAFLSRRNHHRSKATLLRGADACAPNEPDVSVRKSFASGVCSESACIRCRILGGLCRAIRAG
jgi:hypothetical protein